LNKSGQFGYSTRNEQELYCLQNLRNSAYSLFNA
jgi:hypothetical protein